MTSHKDCYGTMFHDSLHFTTNDQMQGKVFSFELDSAGLARTGRGIETDVAEWDDCLACPEFADCYKLCMAKLALENAISRS